MMERYVSAWERLSTWWCEVFHPSWHRQSLNHYLNVCGLCGRTWPP
jgi:hypothetical protein